jgi:hypothetical protein
MKRRKEEATTESHPEEYNSIAAYFKPPLTVCHYRQPSIRFLMGMLYLGFLWELPGLTLMLPLMTD